MDETQTLIEIPQAVYDAGDAALRRNAECAEAVFDMLRAAVPQVVAAELLRLADQLTELAEYLRKEVGGNHAETRAAGLLEGITVIRERAEQLRATDRCPRCDSPSPELHPAMQHEGEVEGCTHEFHGDYRQPTVCPQNEHGQRHTATG